MLSPGARYFFHMGYSILIRQILKIKEFIGSTKTKPRLKSPLGGPLRLNQGGTYRLISVDLILGNLQFEWFAPWLLVVLLAKEKIIVKAISWNWRWKFTFESPLHSFGYVGKSWENAQLMHRMKWYKWLNENILNLNSLCIYYETNCSCFLVSICLLMWEIY